ncbi:DUF2937 family protein [Cognatishimia sp. F0-27]|uniref:DUF2937 family protein n=1 Tax=Cognatishimia sp. F0-27 TaxID=2816855 RepID=UPI001D0C9ED6|nr:DUF2937 family protein [Cognatishimia sp. F0-27]MCC1493641.1 DUF2937 family protein [Cognatishimia sp. F0-27]
MILVLRTAAMAAGLTGAVGLSQFPEFSQQYTQRLGGAVDELSRIVTRHEQWAADRGLSMDAYLAALAGEGPLAAEQAQAIGHDLDRHARLRAALDALEGAGPFTRARLATHIGDREVARAALQAFRPAVPATFEGAVFAGTGFLAGWAGLWALVAFLAGAWAWMTGPFRRVRRR